MKNLSPKAHWETVKGVQTYTQYQEYGSAAASLGGDVKSYAGWMAA